MFLPRLNISVFGVYKDERVSIDIFDAALTGFRKNLTDFRLIFQKIAIYLSGAVEKKFQTEGAFGGISWQQLAESTVKKRKSDHPILEVSGLLRGSFLKGGTGHVEQIDEKHMLWGSGVKYGLFHQTGTGLGFEKDRFESLGAARERVSKQFPTAPMSAVKGRGMARRKIIPQKDEIVFSIASIIRKEIVEHARRVGFAAGGRGLSPLEARKIGQSLLS